jgi:WD40 repeat protein
VLAAEKVYIRCLAFSPRGRTLLSGSEEGVLKVWDVVERKELFAVRGDKIRIMSVGFSSDGSLAVMSGWEEGAKVWKVAK